MSIFKKGTCIDPTTYCPVSLTSIICKVTEHILYSRVPDHLDKHQILSDANLGFRQGHFCETQLLLTTHDLLKHHDRLHEVDVGILDFSKAFNNVQHRRLINKLHLYRIGGRILHWIQAFLSDRQQLVLCHGVKSQFSPVTSGAPQGNVLGPLLFLLHINDLPSVVDPNTSVRLFSDDALVYWVINTIQDQVIFQQDFARLKGWDKACCMGFKTPNVTWCTSTVELHQVVFLPDMQGILKHCHQREILWGTQSHRTQVGHFTSTEWRQRPHRSSDSSTATSEEPLHNRDRKSGRHNLWHCTNSFWCWWHATDLDTILEGAFKLSACVVLTIVQSPWSCPTRCSLMCFLAIYLD